MHAEKYNMFLCSAAYGSSLTRRSICGTTQELIILFACIKRKEYIICQGSVIYMMQDDTGSKLVELVGHHRFENAQKCLDSEEKQVRHYEMLLLRGDFQREIKKAQQISYAEYRIWTQCIESGRYKIATETPDSA